MNNQNSEIDLLIQRIRTRAADPERRTDYRPSVFDERVQRLDFGSLLMEGRRAGDDLRRIVDANRQGNVPQDLVSRADRLAEEMTTPASSRLPVPASEPSIASAESGLGFAIPALLRRLYSEVADGGFGPSSGLLSIAGASELYEDMRRGGLLPRGRRWPEHLLPIVQDSAVIYCIDVSTQQDRVVVWDPEDLDEIVSSATWSRSFRPEAPSLRAWFEDWLTGPTLEERFQAQFGDQMMAAQIETARQSRAMIAAMSPEERAAMGLPEVGWERIVWGGLGLDED